MQIGLILYLYLTLETSRYQHKAARLRVMRLYDALCAVCALRQYCIFNARLCLRVRCVQLGKRMCLSHKLSK